MTMASIFRLSQATVLDVDGNDSAAILHNLTTNDVKALGLGNSCETFITDVRGKMLAHVFAYRTENGFRLIGAPGQGDAIIAHADRYTIREDAVPTDRSSEMTVYVVSPDAPTSLTAETDWKESNAAVYSLAWLGEGTLALVTDTAGAIEQVLRSLGESAGSEEDFHSSRIRAGFPWYGIDVSEKNLPQEASRINDSISFTKGCYLGQETVARLDALGQVQKQLVRWQCEGAIPAPGSELKSDDKVVGKLTSVTATGADTATAIGMARRTHFDPGSVAEGDGFRGTVVE